MAGSIKGFRQKDSTDCGPACLKVILNYFGKEASLAGLRHLTGTDKNGTSIWGLARVARENQLTARAVKISSNQLSLAGFPAIAHMKKEAGQYHYVVVAGLRRTRIRLMDPADGKLFWCRKDEFLQRWTGILLLLTPLAGFMRSAGKPGLWRRLWLLMQVQQQSLLMMMLGAVAYTLLGSGMAIFLQQLVDQVLVSGDTGALYVMSFLMLLVIALQAILGWIRDLLGFHTGMRMDTMLVTGYIYHLFRLPLSLLQGFRTGEISSRLGDAIKVRLLINDIGMGMVLQLLMIVCTGAIMWMYHWKLALLAFGSVSFFAGIYYVSQRYNRIVQRKLAEHGAAFEASLVETLERVEIVKFRGLEDWAGRRVEEKWMALVDLMRRAIVTNMGLETITETLNKCLVLLVLVVGAGAVLLGSMTTGALLSFYTLMAYFTAPIGALIGSVRNVQDAIIAADRLFELTDLEPEAYENESSILDAGKSSAAIRFEDVGFSYPNGKKVFDALNLVLQTGRIHVLTGANGSGKSTLAALLQRHYLQQEGQIYWGEHRLCQYSLRTLRKKIAWVPAKVQLFCGTVWENLRLDEEEPDVERMLAWSRRTGFDEVVSGLPGGYQTVVGENGWQLSAGQQQKLAITRALYQEPALLILDEAMANLDDVAERAMLELFRELAAAGTTALLITHRKETRQWADCLHVLKDGRCLSTAMDRQ